MTATKERSAKREKRNDRPPTRVVEPVDDSEIDAALLQLLDLEPGALKRLLAKAVLSGKYGRTQSLRAVLRKMLFDAALRLNETTAVRGVTDFRDMG